MISVGFPNAVPASQISSFCTHSLCLVSTFSCGEFCSYLVTSGQNKDRILPFAYPGLPLPLDTSSSQSLRWAKARIDACDCRHRCYNPENSRLPNRVLDVSGERLDSDVKLYLTSNERARYMCLSHCWGEQGSCITTTRETLAQHIRGISFESLPNTFKDAVNLTRQFGVQYLWIDSLCILQGDEDDWRKECTQMATIYENAYLTIAATASSNCNGGLYRSVPFQDRDREFKYVLDSGRSVPVYFRESTKHPDFRKSADLKIKEYPLLTRAWVFQERVLSSRFLQFCKKELVFECQEDYDCQCKEGMLSTKERFSKALRGKSHKGSWRPSNWDAFVEEYTSLSVTFSRDRLPAISAVARRMSQLNGDKYLAGLWEHDLPRSLGWFSQPAYRQRLPEPRAPSWSWASISSAIFYPSYPDDDVWVKVNGFQCTPLGDDIFAQVKSGTLILEGKVTPSRLRWSFSAFSLLGGESRQVKSWSIDALNNGWISRHIRRRSARKSMPYDPYEESPFVFVPDYQFYHGISSPLNIYCLWLSSNIYSKWFVLILRAVSSESDKFERIGICRVCLAEDEKPWEHVAASNMTLEII